MVACAYVLDLDRKRLYARFDLSPNSDDVLAPHVPEKNTFSLNLVATAVDFVCATAGRTSIISPAWIVQGIGTT